MNKFVTKIRETILNKQVDIRIYGTGCMLSENDRDTIYKCILIGKTKGNIGTTQVGREDKVYACWSIPFEDVKVGDKVTFNTAGKYNPGFSTTETYIGIVKRITEEGRFIIEIETGASASVSITHIDKIL